MYQHELDRLKRQGEPLTVRELAPKVPEGHDNAANLYAELPSLDRMTAFMKTIPGYTSDKWNAAWRARARQAVTANQGYFRVLEQASRIEECAFPVDWEAGQMALMPHPRYLREAARWLQVRAEVQLLDGRPGEAAASCAGILRVADHAGCGPSILEALVAQAIRTIALRELARLLASDSLTRPTCLSLYRQLESIDSAGALLRTVRGERASWVQTFALLERGEGVAPMFGEESALQVDRYQSFGRPSWNLDKLSYLRASEKYLAALDKPWAEARERAKTLSVEIARLRLNDVTDGAFDLNFTPFLLWQSRGDAARMGAARTALAAVLYRHDHGRYPDSLEELEKAGWKLPLDPFTAKPLRYRREPDGFAVWSLGPDMTNNNARDFNPAKDQWDTLGYDLVFRVAR
jgi:hypothetical protein